MRTTFYFFALVLAACGGDDGDASLDASTGDGGGGGDCLAPTDLGAATLLSQRATSAGTPVTSMLVGGLLDGSESPDLLQIELYDGQGSLAGGIAAGSYQISGDDLDYATCGVCARILTDLDPVTGNATDAGYLATAGTLTIEATTPTLTGQLVGASFAHVILDAASAQTPHPDGCRSAIDSVSFDAFVEATP